MNLEALISALVPGRAKGGIEAGPDPRPGSPGFEDWLQQAAEPVPPLSGQSEMGADEPHPPTHFAENTAGKRASRRAADLSPPANAGAIAFAERPLLVETSLQFGVDTPGLSPRPSDIRWIGEVLQYRIADLLQGRIGDGHGDRSVRSLAPLPVHSGGDRRPNPADKRPSIFSMVPVAQTAIENSPVPQGDGAEESARPTAGRRDQTAGALAARLMEHFGRVNPNGPLVHLQPEQDGLWRLFLRLPKLPESALAELGGELKSLMHTFGLKLGTFEIVETPNREAR
jgi:hypothetical protein